MRLPHAALEEAPRLGHGPDHAQRGAGHGADSAERRHEQELLPDRGLDVRRDFGVHAGARQRVPQAQGPLARPAVELAELHEVRRSDAANLSRCGDEAQRPRKTAQHGTLPENLHELPGGLDAVVQRADDGVGADHRPHGARRLRNLPGLDRQEHGVDDADLGRIVRRLRRMDEDRAGIGHDLEPGAADRLEVRSRARKTTSSPASERRAPK